MKTVSTRRSLLYVPGNSEKMIDKALQLDADSIILDLEDAVSLSHKEKARGIVCDNIHRFRQRKKELIVRINDVKTKLGVLDIEAIAVHRPDAIIIPKADDRSLEVADSLIRSVEMRFDIESDQIDLIPLFETCYGIIHAHKILTISDRISAIQFGAEDLTNEMGIERTALGNEILFSRCQLALVGTAHKVDILDTPFTDISDNNGLLTDAINAKNIGFTGKTCIHPNQISTINEVFTPEIKKVEKAKQVVMAFAEAERNGQGACMFEGKMIDAPIVERAKKLINKAERVHGYR